MQVLRFIELKCIYTVGMAAALNVCEGCEIDKMLESFCVNCEQLYCQECTTYHMKCKTTRSHILLDASHRDTDINHSSIEVKCGNECGEQVVSLCLDCRQLLCIDCFNKHSMLKATKEHNAITAKHLTDSHPRVIESRPSVVSHPQQLVRAQVQVEKGQYSGTFTNKFKCSAPGDKEVARVRGIAILSDGRIVVADYKNRSLKLFNSELRFETVKYIKEDPRGIATSANDFVVVTIADKKEIRIYKFEKIRYALTKR
ncbi:unnamed protein product [Mytilus edulis]|uniref:B box-type domain-containing protein n=1 Tax=Mytilus edulis TaxID=6550 RepID=A0A8S3UGV0_MYTED|nr:unnamed protein product [Mytilus edulis]